MGGLKTVYSRDGIPIADIRAAVIRSSLLNDIGEAIFNVPTRSTKCRRELLEFGNYLLVQHDEMPDWVGIIDTPRVWQNGQVEVHAYEVPFILKYRSMPPNSVVTGTPGEVFQQILGFANNEEMTLLRTGTLFLGGVPAPETLVDDAFSHIKGLSENYRHDWVCTPVVDTSGMLTVQMDWMDTAGIVTDLELAQGHNILYGDSPLEENGEILNKIQSMSNQQGENPMSVIEIHDESRNRFGLRSVKKEYITNQSDGGALSSFALAALDRQHVPDIATPLTVVNRGSAFKSIRVGNIVKYRYTNVGFDGDGLGWSDYVRILGYRFDEAMRTVELQTGKVIL